MRPRAGANGLEPIMPDSILSESDREPKARTHDLTAIPNDPADAYALGYADGHCLLKAEDASEASLKKVRALSGAGGYGAAFASPPGLPRRRARRRRRQPPLPTRAPPRRVTWCRTVNFTPEPKHALI